MAWDASLPANSTKIRLGPAVIRDNWQAIQQADSTFRPYAINLTDRTPLAVSNNPTAISGSNNACTLYCKQDASGNQEIYSIDPSSNVIQLTEGGAMGSTNTDVNMNQFSFDGSITYNENNIITAWAVIDGPTGNILSSSNIASCLKSGGNYTVTLSNTQTSANYVVIAQARDRSVKASTVTTTNFILQGANNLPSNSNISVIVVGGR